MLAEENLSSESSHKREKLKPNICRFFSSKAGCRFGDKCKFKHEVLKEVTVLSSQKALQSSDFDELSVSHHEELNQSTSATAPSKSLTSTLAEVGAETSESEVKHKEDDLVESDTNIDLKVCDHFLKKGWCRFGKRCRFAHPKRERQRKTSLKPDGDYNEERGVSENPDNDLEECAAAKGEIKTVQVQKPRNRKQLCRFYLNGNCRYGDRCKFSHDSRKEEADYQLKDGQVNKDTSSVQSVKAETKAPSNPPRLAKKRGDLTSEDIQHLRKTECDQLKKRFPTGKLQIMSESEDINCYQVDIMPTDPDWPFDIKTFCLKIEFPAQYPLQMFSVESPDDNMLPTIVRHYMEKRIANWLEEKQAKLVEADKVELVFRPFLRWFDRTLEDIVTEGLRRYQRDLAARAAGFEFIPAKPVSERSQMEDDIPEPEKDGEDDEETTEEDEGEGDTDLGTYSGSESGEEPDRTASSNNYADVERKGTEVLLRSLQLKENAATLLLDKLAIIIQCERCKTNTEFKTPGGRLNLIPCAKCYNEQRVLFRPALTHHFSAVVGYLDMANCLPHDLILQDCVGVVSCLNCSRNMKLEGLVPGQVKQMWCQRCHKKLVIATESVRFQQLQPSELTVELPAHQIQVSKQRKVGRDPAIQEGKPLPAEGTCKHYKKSFRWLRFPCCGKCYPCDICHDDKEGDHEMKFASRMICGFCCKEQPYTVEKPCVLCGSHLTKMHSSHWEGGRGCRDKIRMSRNDVHKYSSMSKTVSKKAQEKQDSKKSGKKTTKLRHA
ncbi:uncharacterized protein LOC135472674 [Liolophura sinensis]|uniref:uncharacterized protein LOC135472674 n=1 Tax=Liolophura sinensis TaxID=3198878 RepID=UPI0031582587